MTCICGGGGFSEGDSRRGQDKPAVWAHTGPCVWSQILDKAEEKYECSKVKWEEQSLRVWAQTGHTVGADVFASLMCVLDI